MQTKGEGEAPAQTKTAEKEIGTRSFYHRSQVVEVEAQVAVERQITIAVVAEGAEARVEDATDVAGAPVQKSQ